MNHESLIADLVEEATPVAPLNLFKRCCGVVVGLSLYLALLVFGLGIRDDWAEQMAGQAYPLEMLITLVLALGGAIMAMKLSVPREGKFPFGWVMVLLALSMGAVIWLLGQVSLQSFAASMESDHFYITLGVIAGATPVALALFYLLRQGSPTQLAWAGSMALLSASATGHFLMRTIGKADNFADVLVWCYSPILLGAILGVILGQKALRW